MADLSRDELYELSGLLDELEWLVDQVNLADWRLFSQVYDTRSACKMALARMQRRLITQAKETTHV